MKKSIVSWSVLALVVGASFAGCTLITEVDRSKIKDNAGGDSGDGGSAGAGSGGTNTGGSSGGEGGAATGGASVGGAGGEGGAS